MQDLWTSMAAVAFCCPAFPRPGHLFRLALHTVLQETENAVNVFAPICNSWGLPAWSTSGRTYFNWQGNESYGFVRSANIMVSRSLDHHLINKLPIKGGPTMFDHPGQPLNLCHRESFKFSNLPALPF